MGIHVADLLGLDASVAHGIAHHPEATFAIFRRLSDVIGVGAHTIARYFRDDAGAAFFRVLEFFQDKDARTLTDDEAVAVLVPRAAGVFGIVVAGGKGTHGPAAERGDGSFGAAGYHHVGVAILDDASSVADGMGAGSASGTGSFVGALGVVPDAYMPGGQVHNRRGNKERRNLARAAVEQVGVLALDDVKSADSRA